MWCVLIRYIRTLTGLKLTTTGRPRLATTAHTFFGASSRRGNVVVIVATTAMKNASITCPNIAQSTTAPLPLEDHPLAPPPHRRPHVLAASMWHQWPPVPPRTRHLRINITTNSHRILPRTAPTKVCQKNFLRKRFQKILVELRQNLISENLEIMEDFLL